jgi:glycerol-3-phosphate dehydrogenase
MNRAVQLQSLQQNVQWDIIVIGGGATGLGIAVDAANRGLKTLLLEKYDFAKGTSSRSTKLLHGGVRYLAQGNIKLVKSALKERGLLLQNAPHLSSRLNFIIPALRWYDKFFYGVGLKIYDLLAGKLKLNKTQILNKKTTLQQMPNCDASKIRGGIMYQDGQFDDARFALSLAATAMVQGATVLNHFEVTQLTKTNGIVNGVVAYDHYNNQEYTLYAKTIINATGVFVEDILKLDTPDNYKLLAPSQGVHIVLDKKYFNSNEALMIPKTTDGRVLFAIPWHGKVVIGTTDTLVKETYYEPKATEAEVNFIIDNFNYYTSMPIDKKDILSVYTGLRPLIKKADIKSTAALNRDHSILIHPSKLITITGGKWTTYRKMAKDLVDKVYEQWRLPIVPCQTENIKLANYSEENNIPEYLKGYGTAAIIVLKMAAENYELAEKIHPSYDYIKAQIVWAVKEEMALTVEDVLARRLRLLLLDAKAAIGAAPIVAKIMAKELLKDELWIKKELEDFNSLAKNYLYQ